MDCKNCTIDNDPCIVSNISVKIVTEKVGSIMGRCTVLSDAAVDSFSSKTLDAKQTSCKKQLISSITRQTIILTNYAKKTHKIGHHSPWTHRLMHFCTCDICLQHFDNNFPETNDKCMSYTHKPSMENNYSYKYENLNDSIMFIQHYI